MPGPRRHTQIGAAYSPHGFYSATRRLSDFGGHFYLEIICRYCRHGAALKANALAARFGKDTQMSEIEIRLCCKSCGRKDFELKMTFNRKPRGWNTHP